MKILVFGAGVIGTIYGQVLAAAGHQVTHYVRPGKAAQFSTGITLHLLDGRSQSQTERSMKYELRAVEQFRPKDGYDLILVSVRHYQLESALQILAASAGTTDILFFNALWSDFSLVDRYIPRGQYLWGYPVAGGAITETTLNGALLNEVRLGEIDGKRTERLSRLITMFESAQLNVDVSDDILRWLWIHFAQEAAVIGVGFKTGSADKLINNVGALHEVILCMRETWEICEARGVDLKKYQQELSMFYQPAWLGSLAFRLFFRTHQLERKIMVSHTGEEELKHIYQDVLREGRRLHVAMPHFAALEPYVEQYHHPASLIVGHA